MATKRREYLEYNEDGEATGEGREVYGLPDVFAEKCITCKERKIVVNGILTILRTEIESMAFYILQELIIENEIEKDGDCNKIDLKKYGFDVLK